MNEFLKLYEDKGLPSRLKIFFEKEEYKNYRSHFVYGLKGFSREVKLEISFKVKDFDELLDYFSDQGVNDTTPYMIPFILIKDNEPSCFVVDSRNEDCPVLFFDSRENIFQEHSDSLDSFLSKLLTSKDKVPIKKVALATKKALTLLKKKNYTEAITILEDAILNYPEEDESQFFDSNTKVLPEGFKTLANCYLLNKNPIKAKDILERGMRQNIFSCGAYLVEVYSKAFEDHQKAIEVGEQALESIKPTSDYRAWCDLREHLGLVYVKEGIKDKANKMYQELHGGKIENARNSLQSIINENHPNRALAEEILTWFTPK
ncbi:tetratricopeptide repeat protein [Aquimarina litoralis]|uniref:tetratricopeptide repeat protein n=1 Tax=Aquimarina litoralis TaxID=584605 RepID=UPI001C55C698|nr:tetratricopeptide repeat protein [Aquimarina litoralis]MBW1297906.1 tetratricopeptide repeat protein [Aquimarina litoralis]